MVFAMALALAGFNPTDFRGLIAKLTPCNKLLGEIERATSPCSRTSESSGIGSIATSTRSSEGNKSPRPWSSRRSSIQSTDGDTPSLTPISSRANTPTDEFSKNETQSRTLLADESKERDILDLAANLKDPNWQITHPLLPHHDYQMYLTNQFVWTDPQPMEEEYPMRFCCDGCKFAQPSPYLFGERYVQRGSRKSSSKKTRKPRSKK